MWSWVARNRGGVEAMAFGAGLATLHWLVRRYYDHVADEDPDLSEVELTKDAAKAETSSLFPNRCDSDALCPPPAINDSLMHCLSSFRVEGLPSEVSVSELASRASTELAFRDVDLDDVISQTASDDSSLFAPESQTCTRELLLMQHDTVPSLKSCVAPAPSMWLSVCCCFSRKTYPLPEVPVYRTKPASLFLISDDDDEL